MNIKKILEDNKKEIYSANYQFDKVLEVLGRDDIEANYRLDKAKNTLKEKGIEVGVEELEEIYNWMKDEDLLGYGDAWEELTQLKSYNILNSLRNELNKKEQEAHKKFYDRDWTDYGQEQAIIELSEMVKVYRYIRELEEDQIINVPNIIQGELTLENIADYIKEHRGVIK